MTERKKVVVVSPDQNQMRIDKALCLEEEAFPVPACRNFSKRAMSW